jgi:hypothetical protein
MAVFGPELAYAVAWFAIVPLGFAHVLALSRFCAPRPHAARGTE